MNGLLPCLLSMFIALILPGITIGQVHFEASTRDQSVQKIFNSAMTYFYGYLYVEAEHQFRQAVLRDPTCGICYWGIALAKKKQAMELGRPFQAVGVHEIGKAHALKDTAPVFERRLIEAAYRSFSQHPTVSDALVQKSYIDDLHRIYKQFKDSPRYGAESIALLTDAMHYLGAVSAGPGDHQCGFASAKEASEEAIALLRTALKKYPQHPGLNHTYVHLIERQLDDAQALTSAKALATFTQEQVAHFIHMPTHIYWRRGLYSEAIEANLNAIKIDETYFKNGGVGLSSYYYEYHFLHSHHFLANLGILTNNFDMALQYAREIKQLYDPYRMDAMRDYRDVYGTLEHLVLARFAKWKDVLALKAEPSTDRLGKIFITFVEAMAHRHLGDVKSFATKLRSLEHMQVVKESQGDIKTLTLAYLQALDAKFKKRPLTDMELIFDLGQVADLEKKFSSRNPPIWHFPHSLLLAEAAHELRQFDKEEVYRQAFLQLYPKSSFLSPKIDLVGQHREGGR